MNAKIYIFTIILFLGSACGQKDLDLRVGSTVRQQKIEMTEEEVTISALLELKALMGTKTGFSIPDQFEVDIPIILHPIEIGGQMIPINSNGGRQFSNEGSTITYKAIRGDDGAEVNIIGKIPRSKLPNLKCDQAVDVKVKFTRLPPTNLDPDWKLTGKKRETATAENDNIGNISVKCGAVSKGDDVIFRSRTIPTK